MADVPICFDERGGALWLSREEWGVVTDALIEHRESAGVRKAANSESTSDDRATMCAALIGRIGAAARHLRPERSSVPEYGAFPTTVPVWR